MVGCGMGGLNDWRGKRSLGGGIVCELGREV